MNRAQMLRQWDNNFVWHPFTPMSAYADEGAPIIQSGSGFHLTDVDGNRYLDGISALWCNVHGYRVPELDQAIRDQIDQISHSTLLGQSNVAPIELAKKLVDITPEGLNHVFYSDAGATSVEAALKIAVQYHAQKSGNQSNPRIFVHISEAYHGDTYGSISVGPVESFHQPFRDMLFETISVPSPAPSKRPEGYDPEQWLQHCIDCVRKTLEENSGQIAAVIVEPLVQGASGILVHPHGYLKQLRELTQQHDTLLIADEVAVGFGKTGTLFACEQEEVVPDLLCLAKGLTAGYLPLAATLATSKIYDQFLGAPHEGKTFYHGHTYTGNALAAAVAIENLQLIEDRDIISNVRLLEQTIGQELSSLKDHPHVSDVRQKGIMVGIELVQDRGNLVPFPLERRIGHQVTLAARKRGVIVRPLGNVVVLMPALAMPEPDAKHLCQVVIESIDEACSESR